MLKLHFYGENSADHTEALHEGKNTVGRGRGNTLRIADDSVSRDHSELFVQGTEVIVRDLGSRNGTWVGEEALYGRQRGATEGVVLRFGSVRARLELDPFVMTGAAFDETIEDVTAIRHYSQFMRRPAVKQARVAPLETDRSETGPAVPDPTRDRHGITLWLARPAAASSADCAAVTAGESDAPAGRTRDSGKGATPWFHRISTSCGALARQLLAAF